MGNKIISSNPHGKLIAEELREFEQKLQTTLPSQYRKYIIEHNGGDFEKQIVTLPGTEGNTRVHHMYGLHHGPDYLRLSDKYLQFAGTFSSDYLPICDDSFGNKFCLRIKGSNTGAIYFGDHEKMVAPEDIKKLTYLSPSFNDFIENMKSKQESMDIFKQSDPEGYAKFQKQLEEMKELRKQEIEDDTKP